MRIPDPEASNPSNIQHDRQGAHMNTFNFRIISFSLALAAVLGLSGLAAAADFSCGPGMAKLSPEKREIAQKLYEDFSQSTAKTRQELIAKRHELGAQMYSASPDESKVQALVKEISDLRAKLYSARISLKGKLIKECITLGYGGGYGRDMHGGCGPCMHGGRGPGMRGGCGPGMRGGQ